MRSRLIWKEHIPEESHAKIREILMEKWDPVGISDEPQAADEYDSYIPEIHHLLNSNASETEIQDYLFEIVDKRMGMSPPATLEHMKPAAEALRELRLAV
jgi:hypothetical protein